MSFWVIEKSKLETLISEKSEICDRLSNGATQTKDIAMAVAYASALAEHNALVGIFNCLQKRDSIWDAIKSEAA